MDQLKTNLEIREKVAKMTAVRMRERHDSFKTSLPVIRLLKYSDIIVSEHHNCYRWLLVTLQRQHTHTQVHILILSVCML